MKIIIVLKFNDARPYDLINHDFMILWVNGVWFYDFMILWFYDARPYDVMIHDFTIMG